MSLLPSSTLSTTSALTTAVAALQRLDDKLATGMSIPDMAKCRWLTPVEVLHYLDEAMAIATNASSTSSLVKIFTAPPTSPPTNGMLFAYNAARTPNYAQDGIHWVRDKNDEGSGWKAIHGVLARDFDAGDSDGDTDGVAGAQLGCSAANSSSCVNLGKLNDGNSASGSSSSAMHSGAWAEYLSSADRPTFHRREYRAGPNNDIVLLHYLDTVRALRITSELVDRIVLLSADSGAGTSNADATVALPTPRSSVVLGVGGSGSAPGGAAPQQQQSWCSTVEIQQQMASSNNRGNHRKHTRTKSQDLSDTMNILMGMVNHDDAAGTSIAAAVDEHVLNAATDAAFSAVMKHVSPDEAAMVIDSIDAVIGENYVIGEQLKLSMVDIGDDEAAVTNIEDLTAFDIDEAIDQVLAGGGEGDDARCSKSSSSGSGAAKIIEDQILDSMEEVLPEQLRLKLIDTTEKMLEVSGVSWESGKIRKTQDSMNMNPSFNDDASNGSSFGRTLPEILDITPEFHVIGYEPPAFYSKSSGKQRSGSRKNQKQQVVISTETPIPELPPFVDQYYEWQKYAAFVNFQEIADDPQVRSIRFHRLKELTPFSYKCNIPTDITNSIRHIVVVGVLLPKDRRVQRNMRGIELALKLCIQTEWSAAADLVGASPENKKSIEDAVKPVIRGLDRPKFIAPCGGSRMQLLSQISRMKFTMYQSMSSPLMSSPSFVQNVAMQVDGMGGDGVRGKEEKRKRADDYLEEWAGAPGNDPNMPPAEVDRRRKVRFVERISNAIPDTKKASENIFEGENVDNMSDGEIDALLGKLLMSYVKMVIEENKDENELRSEINWCGYAGLTLLHHASFYNFQDLISLLLNNGADPNIGSAEGDTTPLHFAAAAGQKDVLDALIQFGCDPCPIDSTNQTPADHARKSGHFDIARALDSHNKQSGSSFESSGNEKMNVSSSNTTDVFLQSVFKELSLTDKLGLNLFADRSQAAPIAYVSNTSASMDVEDFGANSAFSFISEEDRAKLREAMSLVNEMDLKEMNLKAEHQDVRQYLRQSNYEAISAASSALRRANKKESDILRSASQTADDPSKMQLSRALAMLVLRKNLPS